MKKKSCVPNRFWADYLLNSGMVCPLGMCYKETLGEQAIFLGSYLKCVLHTATVSNNSRAKVYKLKKDSEFYEACRSNMSFSVAHWIQCLPGVQEVTYSNPVKDWRFFCFRLNSQKAVMLVSLLLVHKSTSPFLLSLYHKELTLNLQSQRFWVQYPLLPFFRQWIV